MIPAPLASWCARDLPPIGAGETPARWRQLFDWARTNSVSVARLAEAHHDAVQILNEASLKGDGSIYGVWASVGSGETLRFDPETMTVTGSKAFCSGLGIVDRALVTAQVDDSSVLLDIDTRPAPSIRTDLSQWNTLALAATATGSIHFVDHPVIRMVGDPGWYLNRPGFWHGAIGPAACWAGGAAGIVDTAQSFTPSTLHHHVALGELRAELHLLQALLDDAGRSADRTMTDTVTARQNAYATRHLIERSTARIIDTFDRAFGPRPFVSDPALNQRVMDVRLYTRQHHGDRDLAELGWETQS